MFTGIIEDLGILKKIEKEASNFNFYFESKLTNELKVDQSLCHNGVCLTVVSINNNIYKVTFRNYFRNYARAICCDKNMTMHI